MNNLNRKYNKCLNELIKRYNRFAGPYGLAPLPLKSVTLADALSGSDPPPAPEQEEVTNEEVTNEDMSKMVMEQFLLLRVAKELHRQWGYSREMKYLFDYKCLSESPVDRTLINKEATFDVVGMADKPYEDLPYEVRELYELYAGEIMALLMDSTRSLSDSYPPMFDHIEHLRTYCIETLNEF